MCGAGLWPLEPLNPPWTSSLIIGSIPAVKECEGTPPSYRTGATPTPPMYCLQRVHIQGVNESASRTPWGEQYRHVPYRQHVPCKHQSCEQPMPRIPVPKGVGPCCKAWGTSWKPSTHTTPRLRNRECRGSTTYWDVPLATDSRPR